MLYFQLYMESWITSSNSIVPIQHLSSVNWKLIAITLEILLICFSCNVRLKNHRVPQITKYERFNFLNWFRGITPTCIKLLTGFFFQSHMCYASRKTKDVSIRLCTWFQKICRYIWSEMIIQWTLLYVISHLFMKMFNTQGADFYQIYVVNWGLNSTLKSEILAEYS